MTLAALALALAAAAVHALWNTLLADARDTYATAAVALLVGAVLFAPAAVLTWDVDGAAVPFMVASAALELVYFVLLASAYARADLGFVYPVARGSAPVLVLAVSVAALGASPGVWQAIGVLAVVAGVIAVRGVGRAADRVALVLALGVGACIAGYTLVDDRGIAHAAPLPYFELVAIGAALPYAALVAARSGAGTLRAAFGPRTVVLGIGMFGAYALALAALQRADAAPVAALRETSVVMAALAAAVLGREAVPRRRLAGAAVVVAGAAAIALG
jgi:drug/metabolite transporter (DMT)-like permease